jgi:hypothetical protein
MEVLKLKRNNTHYSQAKTELFHLSSLRPIRSMSTVTPDDGLPLFLRKYIYTESTLVIYFVILPSVSPIVIVIMYRLVPTPKSFEITFFFFFGDI